MDNKNEFLKTKEEISQWLDKYGVSKYILTPDPIYGFTVEVAGQVNLSTEKLYFIPVKFSFVGGDFICSDNQLTSLEFCPATVAGDFYCNDNQLTSLEYCPHTVGGEFACHENNLTSLKFCPTTVGNNFYCHNNQLVSLEFCPSTIGGVFWCSCNRLTTLEFCPMTVEEEFDCSRNKLISLEFCPTSVGTRFFCSGNPDLGAHQHIKDFNDILKIQAAIVIEKEKNYLQQQLSTAPIISTNDKLNSKPLLKV